MLQVIQGDADWNWPGLLADGGWQGHPSLELSAITKRSPELDVNYEAVTIAYFLHWDSFYVPSVLHTPI